MVFCTSVLYSILYSRLTQTRGQKSYVSIEKTGPWNWHFSFPDRFWSKRTISSPGTALITKSVTKSPVVTFQKISNGHAQQLLFKLKVVGTKTRKEEIYGTIFHKNGQLNGLLVRDNQTGRLTQIVLTEITVSAELTVATMETLLAIVTITLNEISRKVLKY